MFRQLVTQSLEQRESVELFNLPVELLEKDEKELVDWVKEYSINYGELPTLERLRKHDPLFFPENSTEPLKDIYNQLLVKRKNLFVRRMLNDNQQKLIDGDDPTDIVKTLFDVCQLGSGDVINYSEFDRSEFFKHVETIRTGIKPLDRVTGGFQQGDLVYIVGRLGTGKSTFALWLVANILLDKKKVLVIPNETRDLSVVAKLDASLAGFNPAKVRNRKWTDSEKSRIKALSLALKSMEGDVVISRKPVRMVSQVDALIKKHKPDIVLIDGVYLMNSDRKNQASWENLTQVSRELKTIALENGLPIIGIHQSKRAQTGVRIDTEDLAYSDALGQDADIVIAINKKEDDGKMLVETIKNRDNFTTSFYIQILFDPLKVNTYEI